MAGLADLVSGAPDRPCGYGQWTDLTVARNLDTATGLTATTKRLSTLEGKPNRALIQAETQDVRWTDDDDVTLAAGVGMLLKVNTVLEYAGDLSRFRFLEAVGGAKLNVSFYNS